MSFGFSIGDFIAVGKLAKDISSLLTSSEKATDEFTTTAEFLNSMPQVFIQVTQDREEMRRMEEEGLLKALTFHVIQCLKIAEEFETEFGRYRAKLGYSSKTSGRDNVSGIASALSTMFKPRLLPTTQSKLMTARTTAERKLAQLRWAAGASPEAAKLRARLTEHTTSINFLLLSSNASRMRALWLKVNDVMEVVRNVDTTTTRINNAILNMHAQVSEVLTIVKEFNTQAPVPRSMGFMSQGTGGDIFFVKDWFGTVHEIPCALVGNTSRLQFISRLLVIQTCPGLNDDSITFRSDWTLDDSHSINNSGSDVTIVAGMRCTLRSKFSLRFGMQEWL